MMLLASGIEDSGATTSQKRKEKMGGLSGLVRPITVINRKNRHNGAPGMLASLRLEDGRDLPVEHLFSHQGATPQTALARSLGVELSGGGYIKGDTEQWTSEPFVYAAGDCTRLLAHQVVTAAHEGATAA